MDATNYLTTFSMLFLTLCLFVEKGLSISCYTCNTYHHRDDCRKLPEKVQYLYKINCSELPGNFNYTKCRTMVQSFAEETRIIRQCAVHNDQTDGCKTKIGTKRYRVEYCECSGDLCNSSTKLDFSPLIVMTMLFIVGQV